MYKKKKGQPFIQYYLIKTLVLSCLNVRSESVFADIPLALPNKNFLGSFDPNEIHAATQSLVPDEGERRFGLWRDSFQNKAIEEVSRTFTFSDRNSTRILEDFGTFKGLFQNIVLRLPSQAVTVLRMNISVTNIECHGITFGDLIVDHKIENDQIHAIELDIIDLEFICDLDFTWDRRFMSDSGHATMTSNDNSLGAVFSFLSNDFNKYAPRDVLVESCTSDITIDNLELKGSVISTVMDVFDFLVKNIIENELSEMACAEFGSFSDTFMADVLETIAGSFIPYSDPAEAWRLDPAHSEKNLEVPGVEVINFYDADAGELENLIFKLISSVPGSGINILIRNSFLDNEGAFTLNVANLPFLDPLLFDGHDKLIEMKIILDKMKVFGLDTLTRFNPSLQAGNQTYQFDLKWDHLTIEAFTTVDIKPSSRNDSLLESPLPVNVIKKIKINFGADDVESMVAVLLKMDKRAFSDLQIGSMLFSENIIPCLLSVTHEILVMGFHASIGNIHKPILSDFISPELDRVATTFAEAILSMYEKVILNSLPSMFQRKVRYFINEHLSKKVVEADCVQAGIIDEFIDFRDLFLEAEDAKTFGGFGDQRYGNVVSKVMGVLRKQFMMVGDDNLKRFNSEVIGPITRKKSGEAGTLYFPGNLFHRWKSIDIGEFSASIGFRLSDARIENLDQFGGALTFLNVVVNEAYKLKNEATMGVGGVPVRLVFRLLVEMHEEDRTQLRNDMEISLDFHSAAIALTTLVKVSEERFVRFPLRDLFNIDCWLATTPAPVLDMWGVQVEGTDRSAEITHLVASVSRLDLQVECISCSSPGVNDLVRILPTSADKDNLTAMANQLLESITDIGGGELFQMQINRRLSQAELKCPHNPRYDPAAEQIMYKTFQRKSAQHLSSLFLLLISVGAFAISFSVIVALVVRWTVRRRHRKWLKSLSIHHFNQVMQQQMMDNLQESELNAKTLSMYQSSEIPVFVRYLMPLITVGNIAFFLSGHLSLGATVTIEGQFMGEQLSVEDFFSFSIAQSTIDMWEAGGRTPAVFILIFSIIWPYSKQLITLSVWFLKPSTVSVSLRGNILLWLDALAKWSMADIFILVVTIAAFRVTIVSPDADFLPDDFYSVNLMVVPKWGLYANMTAQIISQITSHFVVHYHRKIVDQATKRYEGRNISEQRLVIDSDAYIDEPSHAPNEQKEQKEPLHQHAFSRPHRGETEKLITRYYVNHLVYAAAALLSILLVLGSIFPSFSLEVFGIVGIVADFGHGSAEHVINQSVFSLARLLMDQARFLGTTKDYIGLGSLSALLILCVLIVPLIQTVALLCQWFCSMSRKTRVKLSAAIEILQAWQYTEVYILSAIFSSWQLGTVSQFMFNPHCKNIDNKLGMLDYYGIVDGRDAQCFQVQASIESATYIIFAGAALLITLNAFIMKGTAQYFRDKNISQSKLSSTASISEGEELKITTKDVNNTQPVPILFSDAFRWMLIRRDTVVTLGDATNTYDLEGQSSDEE